MIRTNITLTAPRFSSEPATIPTIEVWDEARSPEAHRRVMTAAHLLAARLWTTNIAGRHLMGRPVSVDTTCDAGAQVTVETLTRNPEEREEVLRLMRAAVAEMGGKRGRAFRPDGREIIVSILE